MSDKENSKPLPTHSDIIQTEHSLEEEEEAPLSAFDEDVMKFYELHKMLKEAKKERRQINSSQKKKRGDVLKDKKKESNAGRKIDVKLMQQSHSGLSELHGDDLVQALGKLKRLELQDCRIESTDNLEWYSQATHVYLQHNRIQEMGDVWMFMSNLEFLAIFDNQIEKIENLNMCSSLKMLDIRQNKLSELDIAELPQSIQYLFIEGNPKIQIDKTALAKHLPTLVQLDDEIITLKMRKEWGLEVSAQHETILKVLLEELGPTQQEQHCQNQMETALKLHGVPERPKNRTKGHNSTRYEELLREQELMANLQKKKMAQIADQQRKQMEQALQSTLKRIQKKAPNKKMPAKSKPI